jgi:two-component system response regulator MprA
MTEQVGAGEDATRSGEVCVLVIDDDDDVRETVRIVLEAEGYSVAVAQGGAAALDLLARVRPRLILLDLTMPGMDGASFRELQLRDESLAAIPTIVMTARANAGASAGPLLARACLAKPVELEELLSLVDHYCSDGRGTALPSGTNGT